MTFLLLFVQSFEASSLVIVVMVLVRKVSLGLSKVVNALAVTSNLLGKESRSEVEKEVDSNASAADHGQHVQQSSCDIAAARARVFRAWLLRRGNTGRIGAGSTGDVVSSGAQSVGVGSSGA